MPNGLIATAGRGSPTCAVCKDVPLRKREGVTQDRRPIFILWGRSSTPRASDLRADFAHILIATGVAGLVPATPRFRHGAELRLGACQLACETVCKASHYRHGGDEVSNRAR